MSGPQHSMQVLNLALRIADHPVRSDIELYATVHLADDDSLMYDITKPDCNEEGEAPRCQAVIDDALRYITLRGEVFPWRLNRSVTGNIVWFTNKEPA